MLYQSYPPKKKASIKQVYTLASPSSLRKKSQGQCKTGRSKKHFIMPLLVQRIKQLFCLVLIPHALI